MKRYIPILLAVILLLSACSGGKPAASQTPVPDEKPQTASSEQSEQTAEATPDEEEQSIPGETDWLSLYAPVFDSYRVLFGVVNAYLQGSDEPVDLSGSDYDLESNLSLFLESQSKAGFCLKDLDGNGIPELIIGLMTDDLFYSRIVASLFTIEDGTPKLVFSSMTRSRYCFSSEGGFVYEGSGGAAYSDYYKCSLSGSDLKVENGAYSDGENGFFRYEGGDRESAALTESIDEQQFAEYFRELDSLIIAPPELSFMDIDQ